MNFFEGGKSSCKRDIAAGKLFVHFLVDTITGGKQTQAPPQTPRHIHH